MIQRRSILGRYGLFALGLTICCIGVVLAQSIRARRVQQRQSDPPAASLSPPVFSFGVQVVGTSSSQQAITLTNNGSGPLTINNIAIAGGNSGDFSLSQNCPHTLPADAVCTLSLTFTPTAPGPRKSLVSINDNAGTGTQTGVLSGVGTAISFSPASLTFGDGPQTVTVTNRGSSALNLWQIAIVGANAGDFSKTTTCGSTLDAGADCSVSVTFTPTAAGMRGASLLFSDNGGGRQQAVALTGVGQFMALSADKTHLVNTFTNKPVFITGEAAWSLQGALSDADIAIYLSDRASRGFNLIIVDLAENYYSDNPPHDFYGSAPFDGADFTNEDEAYWSRVDRTIGLAASYGITVTADPAFVGYGCSGGYCTSYRNSSLDAMTAYGRWLGSRYRNFPNVIWLIGGDADPSDSDVQSKLSALATAIKAADGNHLMTTESYPATSSVDVWNGAAWLDLDALYQRPSGLPTKANLDYQSSSYPIFELEDWYEGEHSMTGFQTRVEGYWAVLSGCTRGRLFGNYAIWDFSWRHDTTDPWKNQLGSVGSVGQSWLGKLFRSREHWKLVPDINHTVVTAGYGTLGTWPQATLTTTGRTSDGQTIIAYIPNGNAATLTLDMSKITSASSIAKCWWFNPSSGSTTLIGSFANSGTRNFTPPDSNDWVLVIDDARVQQMRAPGSADL